MVCYNDNMKNNDNNKITGFINEEHINDVNEVFGKEIAEQMQVAEGKTFLDILRENGAFDLTNKDK